MLTIELTKGQTTIIDDIDSDLAAREYFGKFALTNFED